MPTPITLPHLDTHPDTRCRHCQQPLRRHGGASNPVRPFACPGRKEPAWPRTIRDEQRAGALYDRRLQKFRAERTTSFAEVA